MSQGPKPPLPPSGMSVTVQQSRTPFLVRAIWFLFVGWWLSGIVIAIGYLLCLLVVTLPLGIYLLHRVPQVQTLRDRTMAFETREVNGRIVFSASTIGQRPFVLRVVWFVLVGWWLSGLWLAMAWVISLTLIGLPLSIWMIDRVPAVLTLQRN